MPEFGIDFFLKGLGARVQIGLFLILGVAAFMVAVIGFTIWQERTFHRKK